MKTFFLWLRRYSILFKVLRYLFIFISIFALYKWVRKEEITVAGKALDSEALFATLSGISLALNVFYMWLLREATYSPAFTLAYGYVENFLQPVIIQLLEKGIKKPHILVYRAIIVEDLSKANIDIIKAELKQKAYTLKEVQLDLKYSRARDVLTIQGSGKEDIFFDLPNTITTLYDYISYKTSDLGTFPKPNMQKISETLLNEFYGQVQELMKVKKLDAYYSFCQNINEI